VNEDVMSPEIEPDEIHDIQLVKTRTVQINNAAANRRGGSVTGTPHWFSMQTSL
jgi:hypothetical protein